MVSHGKGTSNNNNTCQFHGVTWEGYVQQQQHMPIPWCHMGRVRPTTTTHANSMASHGKGTSNNNNTCQFHGVTWEGYVQQQQHMPIPWRHMGRVRPTTTTHANSMASHGKGTSNNNN